MINASSSNSIQKISVSSGNITSPNPEISQKNELTGEKPIVAGEMNQENTKISDNRGKKKDSPLEANEIVDKSSKSEKEEDSQATETTSSDNTFENASQVVGNFFQNPTNISPIAETEVTSKEESPTPPADANPLDTLINSELSAEVKNEALDELRLTRLSKDESLELLEHLQSEIESDLVTEVAFRNELLELLINNADPFAELIPGMVSIITDPNTDEVWRDYVVQHAFWVIDDPHFSKKENQVSLINALNSEAGRAHRTAGTAVVSTHEIAKSRPDVVSLAHVESTASAIVKSNPSEMARTSALQILTELDSDQALEEARKQITRAISPPYIAACAFVIGEKGDQSDIALLEGLNNSAAKSSALKKIRER